jgi:ABC-type phosphate transport system substrate-binding protein
MRRLVCIVFVIVFVSVAMPPAGGAADLPLAVITHRDRVAHFSIADVSGIYLKQRRFWPDGQPIIPLNLEAGSAAREAFSQAVLGDDSRAFNDYWNQRYFQGVFPPATLSSSEGVKRYVAAERNAIGYIEASAVDDTVRVILRIE